MEERKEGLIKGGPEQKGDADTQSDLPLLMDEKFDFDLSLSSSSANEDDEIFFGPVGHRERCVAASLELQGLVPKEAEQPLTWSPLAGEKFVEIFKEARLLALQIESSGKKMTPRACESEPTLTPAPGPGPGEEFVQEARLKLDIFERGLRGQRSSLALKRETYCVLSPEGASVQTSLAFAKSPGAPEPAAGSCLQSQAMTEKKAMSRLQQPKSSSVPGKGVPAKPQPRKQTHSSRLLPGSSRASLGAGSLDQPSCASEASMPPGSGGGATKDLPAPSKFGARKTLMKPPGPARTHLGGKSTPFSGPTCSVKPTSNSSSLGTPARGKAQPSDPGSRLADMPRPTPRPAPGSQPSRGTISCPKQTRTALATPFTGRAKDSASISLQQPQTPRDGLRRLSSNPSLSRSAQSIKPRSSGSVTKVGPSTSSALRRPFSVGTSPDSATPRAQGQGQSQLPSGRSFRSTALQDTPARCSTGGTLQPPSSSMRTPLNVRRLSLLPTPSTRRASVLPAWPTPRTVPRATSPPPQVAAQPPVQAPPKKVEGRPMQVQKKSRPGAPRRSDSPLVVPLALDFASPEETAPGSPGDEAKEQPVAKPAPLEAVLVDIEPEASTTIPATPKLPLDSQPLVDFTNTLEAAPGRLPLTPATAGVGQLLIDLFNSPEGPTGVPYKPLPATGQLIDLSSPLISLSPMENKENLDSPLLKF